MKEEIKIINIKLPWSVYGELLLHAEKSNISPNEWVVKGITSILKLSIEKPELLSKLEEKRNELRNNCPIIKMAETILGRITT